MIKIGLTGSRYSGKDTVAKLFEQIKVPVFNADIILKFILNFDINVNKDILDNYGEYIFTGPESMIDPKKIRSKKDFDKLVNFAEFELKRAYERFRLENKQSVYTIFHSSILFERGWDKEMDFTINVFAPKDVRSLRCEKITKQSTYNISELMKGEMDDLFKNKLADYTIHNYASCAIAFGDTCDQVNRIDQKIIDKYLIKEQTLIKYSVK
jgi:dephospho-CoA kinase